MRASRFRPKSIDLAIEKPVFDRLTSLGSCRPDFLLEARSRLTGETRRIVLQAMGGSSAQYLATKMAHHRFLEHIAPVVSTTPHDVARGLLFGRLADALLR